jgi:lipoprotein-releasing system permease protein
VIAAAERFLDVLRAAGGTLALSFIVALALSLLALLFFYVGSAAVVLDRFARESRRAGSLAAACLVWGALAALLGRELAAEPDRFGPGAVALRAVAGAALAFGVCLVARAVLRRARGRWLGTAVLAVLGLGFALAVGATGEVSYTGVPAASAAGLSGLLALAARRTRSAALAEAARSLAVFAAGLGVGVVVALATRNAPQPELAAAGGLALGVVAALVLGILLPLGAAGFVDLRGGAEWWIAARYLVAKRRQTFISVITAICVLGVAAGVWLIISVLSVMNGFERTWREEIIGNRAHFTVHSSLGTFENYAEVLERVRAVPEVLAANPYLDAEGMVRGPNGEIIGVRVRGVDPARVVEVTELGEDVVDGSIEALAAPPAEGQAPGIAIGSQLAAALGLHVGDTVLLVAPFGGPPTPLGPAPRLKSFSVAAIFQSSFFQYDEIFTYVSLAAAQDFRRLPDVAEGIEVRVGDYYRSQRVADTVQALLGFPFYTRDWKEFFPAFFQALKTERVMMFILLAMIMVVSAFVIVATLIMMIMEKTSDIAILKAMGAEDAAIERIFAIEGALIGLSGTALGVAAGVVVTTQLEWIQRQVERLTGIDTLPASIYQFSTFPYEFDPLQIALVIAIAMVLSLGATLLPSRQGARLDPAEALRYE